jgi:hypothetical protein
VRTVFYQFEEFRSETVCPRLFIYVSVTAGALTQVLPLRP